MNEKKHIDRLFQEKFKNFEATPDDAVWDNIHKALHKEKRKRRVIPLWWFAAGVAAMLVLLLTVGNIFNNSDKLNIPENSVVGTESTRGASEFDTQVGIDEAKEDQDASRNDGVHVIANTASSDGIDSKSSTKKKIGSNTDKSAIQLASEDSDKRNINNITNSQDEITASPNDITDSSSSKEGVIAKNTSNLPQLNSVKELIDHTNETDNSILANEKESTEIANVTDKNELKDPKLLKEYQDIIASNKEDEDIEDAIAKANLINEEEKEEQPKRWNISPNVAPVYFNSLGKGSSIDNQFVNNGKSGEVNMSYGISGSYAINDKIKIRAGVNKVNLGYSTDGVTALRNVNSFNMDPDRLALLNINFKGQENMDAYMSTSSFDKASAPQFVVSNPRGSLEQQFGYIEVPLEIEYNILNSKFGMNLIGGFSTLFLNNNEIYSVLDNQRSLLGDANNINTTSYSANLGLGLNYNISQTLKLNIEPMFKYQINTFNNTSGDFRPYFIGVYSGFSFKF